MRLPTTALALTALTLTACGGGSSDGASASAGLEVEPLTVATAFYPYQFLAERIGGDDVRVDVLTPPGVDPHDLELTPRQVGELQSVDLVVYASGFQPAVDTAVDQQAADRAFDAHSAVELTDGYVDLHDHDDDEHGDDDGHGHDDEHADDEAVDGEAETGQDPHVWLDPTRYAAIASALADRMAELRPERADAFRERADELAGELEELDGEYAQGLTGCERRQIVTSHNSFGYVATRYELDQVGIAGLSPEQEPSPRRLAEVATFASENGVTTVFYEDTVSPRIAEQLAREVGARAEVLSPLEGPPSDGDYFSAMRANLETLRSALDCP